MKGPFGVAVLGCGGVSAGHFSAYAAHPAARLVAAVDNRREVAEAAARRWGAARSYASIEEALADPEVQVVDLCLPHDLHAPVAIRAAEAGKHVFVEKPIANTLQEADEMIAAARAHRVLLMVDQTKRYQNRHRRIKAILEQGWVGDPILVKSSYPQDITYAWGHMDAGRLATYWKHDGVISGIGIHTLDLLRWLVGEVAEVQALSSTTDLIAPDRHTEDSGIVLLRFVNGCIGESTVSYVLRRPRMAASWDLMPLQIFGRSGSLVMDEYDRISVHSERLPSELVDGVVELESRPAVGAPRLPAEGMAGAIDHLFDCLAEGREPLTNGEDARRSLELVEAAYRSIAEGRAVQLPLEAETPAPGAGPVATDRETAAR